MSENSGNDRKSNDSRLDATPDLHSKVHWNMSSNILCNYMKKQEYLDMIITNQAIIPRYVIENLDYLKIDGINKICFPMTCFCDIPFSKVSTHMHGRDGFQGYGDYGIAFDKKSLITKNKIQPITYINDNSPLLDDFREAFQLPLSNRFNAIFTSGHSVANLSINLL